jgi:hypothetical protein
MNVPSEPHDDSDRRLERLRQLNRKLDEIIRDGDTKLPQLLAHVADTSTAAAIESLELQREVRDMTLWIKWLTIIITVLTLVMAYVSVAGRNHTFTSSDHAAATPPQSNQNSNQQKTNEKHD